MVTSDNHPNVIKVVHGCVLDPVNGLAAEKNVLAHHWSSKKCNAALVGLDRSFGDGLQFCVCWGATWPAIQLRRGLGLLVLKENRPRNWQLEQVDLMLLRHFIWEAGSRFLHANKGMYFRIQRTLVVRRQTCKCWVVWPANQASQVWTGQAVICQKVPILRGHGCSVAFL